MSRSGFLDRLLVVSTCAILVGAGTAAVLVDPPQAAAASPPPIEIAPEVFFDAETGITIHAYHRTAGNQKYKVPEGTTSLYIEAVGGEGQTPNPNYAGIGGLGGQVTGGLRVQPDKSSTCRSAAAAPATVGIPPTHPAVRRASPSRT
ncbi:hypothetical protein ACHIPZ_03100 [Antrihabitans sp. NCIMB 15449]|uniref:YkuD domain-containing protein n=1 Tax=Antrihabitans spumae TaxID=3373370 RepID=A0ABW7JKQ1_9NOCA